MTKNELDGLGKQLRSNQLVSGSRFAFILADHVLSDIREPQGAMGLIADARKFLANYLVFPLVLLFRLAENCFLYEKN